MKQSYSRQYIKMKEKNSGFTEPSNLTNASIIDDTIVSNKYFKDITFMEEIHNISFDNCVFDNCRFISNIDKCVFFNSRFTKCELANIIIMFSGIHSCLFSNSNMVGVNICDGKISKTELRENNMRYATFSSTSLDKVKLKENNLVEGRFDKVTLSSVELEKDDFTKMEFIGTMMKGIDVSSCKIEGLAISPEGVRGMIVNEVQAIELVSILGIVIK